MYTLLALFALLVLGFSMVAGRLERTVLSSPIVFTLAGVALGSVGLGWLDVTVDGETLRSFAEITLAVVLFTDASRTDLGVLKKHRLIPARLLLIGLPLTIGAGYIAGVVFLPDLPILELAMLATMLAPTDAALGSAVVSNPKVPSELRESLNVESGLNDGICVPVLFIFLALATGQNSDGLALRLVAEEIGIGLVAGVGLTLLSVVAGRSSQAHGWFSDVWRWVTLLAVAIACFSVAQLLGGSGFIACFSGGLLFGALTPPSNDKSELLETVEGMGSLLSLITWVLFGAAVVGPLMASLRWEILAYAVLSLTLVRMVPVYLALLGTDIAPRARLFIGWFGPRGLASVVFIVIVEGALHPEENTLALTVATTILLSIVAHGLTANPLASRMSTKGEE